MTVAIQVSIELTEINCGECGGTYALNERYRRQKHEVGGTWTCPYCKVSWGYVEGENARLKKELEQARKRKEWAEQEAKNATYRERAAKGQVTKLRKRIGNGICPCCKRSFTNLQRHMHTKHPDFRED